MAKDVLVIVGTGGMGEAIARRLAAGRTTLLADFDEAALAALAESMRTDGYAVETAAVDVSAPDSVKALAARADSLGPVRQVAHTAGVSQAHSGAEAILAVDAAGVAYSLEAFGEVIAEGGAGVVIASMAGTFAQGRLPAEAEAALRATPAGRLLDLPLLAPGNFASAAAAYGVAKRANQLRVEAASVTWGARGARVNSISPGIISTRQGRDEFENETAGPVMRAMIEASGTGRAGTPADIAAVAAFLLGPESSFLTGTDLLVDGGVTAAVRSGALALPEA